MCAETTAYLMEPLLQVFNCLGLVRFWPYLFPAANAWFVLHFALPIANIAWRRRCMAARPADGGSWGRWRELLCATVRTTCCLGCTWALVLATFEVERGPASGLRNERNVVAAALNFLNISTAPVLIMLSFKPLRVRWVDGGAAGNVMVLLRPPGLGAGRRLESENVGADANAAPLFRLKLCRTLPVCPVS